MRSKTKNSWKPPQNIDFGKRPAYQFLSAPWVITKWGFIAPHTDGNSFWFTQFGVHIKEFQRVKKCQNGLILILSWSSLPKVGRAKMSYYVNAWLKFCSFLKMQNDLINQTFLINQKFYNQTV